MIQPDELKSDQPLVWSVGTGTQVWQLFRDCVVGNLAGVQRLISAHPTLVRCQYAYRTPLYFAVRENHLEIVAYLLAQGADPLSFAVNDSLLEICHDRGYQDLETHLREHLARITGASDRGELLGEAIRRHQQDQIRAILNSQPELLHVGDRRSNQPIHWAAMTRQLDLIDDLLERGADLEATRFDGARPIHLANGDYHFRGWRDVPEDWPITPRQVIDHLRLRGANCDLGTACHLGDIDRVRQILAADPTSANRLADYVTYYAGAGAPLKNAAAAGHMEIVQLLLQYGADPNLPEPGIAPHGHGLYAAVANRHFEVAKLLLEHGASPNPEVESSADALSRAISNDDHRMIELLCSYGASRAVHLLAYSGDVQTAAAVFQANPRLADDPPALANAAGQGHEAFMRLMFRYVPDLPARTSFPAWSVGAKTPELNELLFAQGLNASQPDWLHVTALHQLARKGDVETARLFLDHGADLQARDEDICSTPLAWAAKYGQEAVVNLFLSRGASVHLPDDPPWATPLAWATRRHHDTIAQMLRQHGATS